ncbi:hypothetical protein [Roseivirga sp. UBA1976]|uniref:hypothetical protein n=1 Tax=Roseivirga sp. UBA1976 TaxID=1947386 RepID=UPI0025799271|nr:hypothetical protein [Roseivirga sp. UBA1976]|tara:strand:+ start:10313 stop:11170 length:858 start_codon:yes stop_codon:yes gene_type:complete
MARTAKEWYDILIAEKETQASLTDLGYEGDDAETLLNDLNSNSKVAVWRLMCWLFAYVAAFFDQFFDIFKAEVDEKLKAIPGNAESLNKEVRKFQYDDPLLFYSDGSYGYAEIDAAKQIIKRVSINTTSAGTQVKVAKEVNGDPSPLSNDELTAFQGYLNEIQYAQKKLVATSTASDKLKLPLTIYYSAIVPLATIKARVELAITEHLKVLNSDTNFDGSFYPLDLLVAIRDVDGVISVDGDDEIEARNDLGEFSIVDRVYYPASGYYTIDDAFPLAATLNYSVE